MSVFAHLNELRKRIVWSLISALAGFAVALVFSGPIYDLFSGIITPLLGDAPLVYTSPADPIILYMKVSLITGCFAASPFIFFQLWLFIAPALKAREKRIGIGFTLGTAILFLGGGSFAYFILLPTTLKFLMSVASQFQPMITITGYFDLALAIILGCALIFEIPVLIFFLSILGIVTGRFLLTRFHYAFFVMAVVAAVVTPTTDIITMLIFLVPMVALYALGIVVAFIFGKRERKSEIDTENQPVL